MNSITSLNIVDTTPTEEAIYIYIYIYIYILEVKIYDFDRFYDLNSDMVDILQYKLYLYISLFY
jgi:hypothetical protein